MYGDVYIQHMGYATAKHNPVTHNTSICADAQK